MSDNIPFEVQMEILKKVPDVKSLVRFRSVSKPWKSFIDSSEFITSYGARDTQPRRLLLRYTHNNEVKCLSFLDDVSFPQQQQYFAPNVSDLVKQLNYSKVIGSSCGLWCLYSRISVERDMVVIWNPSIRKSVGIVVPCELNNDSEKYTYFWFGVCPSTYDPTIVGMSRCFRMNDFNHNKTWQVGIFTLSSKTWKMIPSSNLPRVTIRLRSSIQVATDRFIFWIACDRFAVIDDVSQFKHLILSFDLMAHDFKEVHLPDSIVKVISVDISLSKLNESLVVSGYINELNGRVYGVWMMGEEGGVMTSFSKLFNINTPDSSIRRLLGFRKSGEPIMETVKEDEQFAAVEVYEPCSKHINNLGIYGQRASFFIRPYTETLLLTDHSDGCIISNDY